MLGGIVDRQSSSTCEPPAAGNVPDRPKGFPAQPHPQRTKSAGPRQDTGRKGCTCTTTLPHSRAQSKPQSSRATTFQTSCLSDFCSEKELTAQTGHGPDEWPLVILKELVDNALDACEEARVAPQINVTVDEAGITVADNGPGLPAATVEKLLDYTRRTSSREAYVAPDRGRQGNALKTILAMPYVLEGTQGQVDISARGERHQIVFRYDQIAEQPAISHTTQPDQDVKIGTKIKVWWPAKRMETLTDAGARFLQLADDFAWLNPHLSLTVAWFGTKFTAAVTAAACPKWVASEPTCSHWYTPQTFERLVSAYVINDRGRNEDRSVRELVKEFRGLTARPNKRRFSMKPG